MPRLWVIRAGRENELIEDFLRKEVAILSRNAIPSLGRLKSREAVARVIEETWPAKDKDNVTNAASQLYRFAHEIEDGDFALTFDKIRRTYWLGTVSGSYRSDRSINSQFSHVRTVHWKWPINRDSLSERTKSKINATLTLFLVSENATTEILSLAKKG